MSDINNDQSYATNERPLKLLEIEKEYLLPLLTKNLLTITSRNQSQELLLRKAWLLT